MAVFRKTAAMLLILVIVFCLAGQAAGEGNTWQFDRKGLRNGFAVPVFADGKTRIEDDMVSVKSTSNKAEGAEYFYTVTGRITANKQAMNQPGAYRYLFESLTGSFAKQYPDYSVKESELDDLPVLMLWGRNEQGPSGVIYCPVEKRMLMCTLACQPAEELSSDVCPDLTEEDMLYLVSQLRYDVSQAFISVKEDYYKTIAAGGKLHFSLSFGNAAYKGMEKKAAWSVTDQETGENVPGISISSSGVLSADKNLAKTKRVTVRVSVPDVENYCSYDITVVPAIKKVSVEPKELILYAGTGVSQTFRAVTEPAEVSSHVRWSWKNPSRDFMSGYMTEEGALELTPGTETGQVTVTLTAPNGKTVPAKVRIVQPVTGLKLSTSGNAIPGGTVTVKAALEPEKPFNKAMEWSLDVGADIATISKGKVKISKNAPVGTVITVTCTASGAPEPVRESIEITVQEKK